MLRTPSAGQRAALVAALTCMSAGLNVCVAQAHDAPEAQSDGGGLEEVIVTAQKRAENLQDVPAAVSALTAHELEERGVTDVIGLSGLAPNVQINRIIDVTSIFIRGIGSKFLGSGSDSSVAFHIDGAYVSRPKAHASAFYDIDRIEVLRGPQGDLYGRNATGGSVNVITRKPTEQLDAYGELTVGNYGRMNFEGAMGGPLGERLRARVSVVSLNHDGFGKNIFTGNDIDDQEEYGVRAQLQWLPSDALDVLLIADTYQADDAAGGWHVIGPGRADVPLTGVVLGGTTAADPRDISSETDTVRKLDNKSTTLIATWQFAERWSAKSISAYREAQSRIDTDLDGVELFLAPLTEFEDAKSFSQELQLQWTGERSTGLLGAYYIREDMLGDVQVPFRVLEVLGSTGIGVIPAPFPPGTLFRPKADLDLEAWAIFLHGDYRITDRLKATAGMRYSSERKSTKGTFTAPTPFAPTITPMDDRAHWSDFTPKFSLDYTFTDAVLVYASYAEGFKSGTFVNNPNPPIDPEYVTSYEVGLKSRWLENRLQANLTAFTYDFKDLQVNRIVGAMVLIENAADAKVDGLEAEIAARIGENFDLALNLAYLDARFERYMTADPTHLELGTIDLSGNRLPVAPEFSGSLNLRQRFPLNDGSAVILSGNATWQDDVYFEPFNQPNAFQKAYAEYGARLAWESADERMTLALWGRNLGDKFAVLNGVVSTDVIGYPRLSAVNEPRTYGVDFRYQF